MQLPIQIDSNSHLSLQTQLFEALASLILDGYLMSETRLPATRELSAQLGISRNTVNLVYERLTAEGYIETRIGSGSFVSRDLQSVMFPSRTPKDVQSAAVPRKNARSYTGSFSARRPILFYEGDEKLKIDFRVGRPDPSVFPLKTWRKLTTRHLNHAELALTAYNDPAGLQTLRDVLVKHLRSNRGIRIDTDQVIITAGVQEALNLICRVLVTPGAQAAIESPSYQGAVFTLQSYGVQLLPISVDENGLMVERLPRQHTTLAYVTPSHQFPLGATLPLERRLRLLEWAKKTGCYIIEDDYDSDFRYQSSPMTALQGLDEDERVIYTSTFSKSLGAGIRLGYLVVPRHLIEPFVTAKALLNNGHPWLEQSVLAEFIASGSFENHLRRVRKSCLRRRDTLVSSLTTHFPGSQFSGLEGGMHLVWYLPETLPDAQQLQLQMRKRGVGIYSLSLGHAHEFGHSSERDRIILLGYAALTEEKIQQGVNMIAETLD